MPTFTGTAFADGGPDLLRTRAATAARIQQWLLPDYTPGASYAALSAALVAGANMVAGNFVSSGSSGADRVLTIAAKTMAIVSDVAAADFATLHVALVDTVSSEVLLVGPTDTDAPSDMLTGGTYNCSARTYSLGQATVV
jgi:serine phosphatase RsbU (regulator of sigma subunit)